MGPTVKKRKLNGSAVEEIVFDPSARFDYLTGFHKRKVQRTKAAQEAAAQRARQERIDDRKKIREERKADLERHVREVNALLPAHPAQQDPDSEDYGVKDSEEEWIGLAEEPAEPVDHEAEYIDEDKYTTVTVEEVDVSRDGLSRPRTSDEEQDEADTKTASISKPENTKPKRPLNKKDKDGRPKKKKKKFRYESSADRKLNRVKERAKKSKQAQLRRSG